ncbi:6-phosphofructokinase [Coxiella burnetii]|uniref:6-phosphofructokinase n=1 Tax=Coxiella burnetii TaxID=777 RepID=UPI000163A153|nr:6-phosphofructokinase [Coxiella burnetii]ATN85648.1 6-phosphofructokinase [Coxiella burnetii str. Schperling]EDR36201.1 6-phosphofructokinase [Coxiella burnetii Q321]
MQLGANVTEIKKLIVLTSGGDAPGMNAAIRAVVRTALHYQFEVYGVTAGFAGLVNGQVVPLNSRAVANCIQRGGTILKTGRFKNFRFKAVRDKAREFLKKLQIDAMIVLGGNGSFAGASKLYQEGGPQMIGIPCTIDNDIQGTDYCIGFDTACNTALQAIDKIRDTAFSHERNFLIEVMGRSSGFIAVNVGIAGGAEIIALPEFHVDIDTLTQKIKKQHGKKSASIIVAAEANQPGHSFEVAKQIKEKTGIEYRVCVLGHTQRGGTPTVKDRVLASLMGAQAIEALKKGLTEKMIAYQNGKIAVAPLPDPDNGTRYFADEALLRVNNIICAM